MPVKKISGRLLRGRHLMRAVIYLLPFAAMIVMGGFWLREQGWLLEFFLVCAGLAGLWRLGEILFLRWRRARLAPRDPADTWTPLAEVNPDWGAAEHALYKSICDMIRARLVTPMPWAELQPFALEILAQAAEGSHTGKKSPLDFSLSEALLLGDRILLRVRHNLRRHVPMADTVRISTLLWLWQQRSKLSRGVDAVRWGARIYGAYTGGVLAAAAKKAQNLLLSNTVPGLKDGGELLLQQYILEEVAVAAIDLHSGHLRFTEAELLEIQLSSHLSDLARQAEEDLPLRLLVVGQVSAGKSSLVNALAGDTLAEVDLSPTTHDLVRHEISLSGADFSVIDTQGIDGSAPVFTKLLAEMLEADLLLWVVRANRPARDVDLALLNELRARFDAQPQRRMPPIIVAVTAVDKLLTGWPFPEHILAPEALEQLSAVVRRIPLDLGVTHVLPVASLEPRWNIAELETLIGVQAGEALKVQRNRRRLQRLSSERGVLHETMKAGRGVAKAASTAFGLVKRRLGD